MGVGKTIKKMTSKSIKENAIENLNKILKENERFLVFIISRSFPFFFFGINIFMNLFLILDLKVTKIIK